MTYGIAWTSGNAAYLMADTLVTGGLPADDERTNLNQLQRRVGLDYVQEALLKVSAISPGVACTIAGDVDRAFQLVDFLRNHAPLFGTPAELLTALNNSLGPPADGRDVELLLAWSAPDGAASVAKWDSRTGQIDQGPLLQIGSLQEPHRGHHARTIARAAEEFRLSPAVMLTVAIGLMQAYCVHYDLIAHNVGGATCGLYVQDGQTTWQSDIVSLHFDGQQLLGYTATLARDGILLVDSPYREQITLFNNTWNDRDLELRALRARQWLERWHETVGRFVPDGLNDCRHWLLLNVRERVLTAFISHVPLNEHRGVFEVLSDGQQFSVQLGQLLADIVFRPPAAPFRDNFGIDFRVVQGNRVGAAAAWNEL